MDSYEKYKQSQKSIRNPFYLLFNKLKPMHVAGFIFLFFIANNVVKNNKDNQWIYFALGGLVILYIFSIMKEEQTKTLIPRSVALEIATKDLQSEVGMDKVYPVGTKITPMIYYKDQFLDSGDGPKIIKYNFGFRIKEPHKVEVEVVYQMNPSSGESKGIVEMPLGFTGSDVKDLQLIFPEKIKEEKKE